MYLRIAAVSLVLPFLPLAVESQSASPPRWTVTRDLRIGSDNDPNTTLTAVGTIRVNGRGEVFVTQPRDNRIQVFSSTGQFIRTIGRPGQGPGEFQAVRGLGFLGDTLWAGDNRRIHFFRNDGTFLSTITMLSPQIGGAVLSSPPTRLLRNGTGIVMPGVVAAAITSGEATRTPILVIDRSSRVLDTIGYYLFDNTQLTIRAGDRTLYTSQFFTDAPLVAFAIDGSEWVTVERRAATSSSSGIVRVTRLRTPRDTVYSRSYPYAPAPMSRTLVDSLVRQRARSFAERADPIFPSVAAGEEALRKLLYLPNFMIPVDAAEFAADGSLWLRRAEPSVSTSRWEVHDPRGAVLATVVLPQRFQLKAIYGEAIWGVELDDNDVPFVSRYKITR